MGSINNKIFELHSKLNKRKTKNFESEKKEI